MKIVKIDIMENNRPSKRLLALIEYADGRRRTISFGQRNSKGVYADNAPDKKRLAYIARHSKLNEDWSKPESAGYFSRWVLWEKRTNAEIEKLLKEKTGAEKVNVNFKRYKVVE